MVCKVCSHPRAFEIMSKVFNGTIGYVEASQELDLPQRTVWHCFANHWQMETTENGVTLQLKRAETTDDYVSLLNGMIKRFIAKLDLALKEEITPANVGSMTKLSTECRSLMHDILEFQGKLKSAPLIQLNIMQVQMTKLTSWLLTNLSPEDIVRLEKAIPELMSSNEAVGNVHP